jgi:hypothetical protein
MNADDTQEVPLITTEEDEQPKEENQSEQPKENQSEKKNI